MTADDMACEHCEKPVHLLHDPPCDHGHVACPECGHVTVCVDCRIEAEVEMHRTGVYSEAADPFLRHTIPNPPDPVERDGGYWWDGSFHAVPKMERKP